MRWPIAILLLCCAFAASAETAKKDIAVEENATQKVVESKPEEKVADAPVKAAKEDTKTEVKEDATPDVKEDATPDVKEDATPDVKEDATPDVKDEVVEGEVDGDDGDADEEESAESDEQADPHHIIIHRHRYSLKVCEHGRRTIHCKNGGVFKILYANYGRTSSKFCHKGSHWWWSKKCRAKNSLAVVRRRCHAKRSCTLDAKISVFGDPCRGTYKYLEA